ncbi:MAG: TRL domain-containing protein [Alphaproteobacteria bacterium]
MKKIFLSLAILLGTSACSYDRTPLMNTSDLSRVDFSKISEMKKGEDCSTTVLFFGPYGDRSIVNATKKARISKVEVVDYTANSYIFSSQSCVVVYGH